MAFACELGTLVSPERKQTIVVGRPPIVLGLGPRADDGTDALRFGLRRREVSRLDRCAFTRVFGVNREGAHNSAANGLLLPHLITGGGCQIVAIFLIHICFLTAGKILYWVVNNRSVIGALLIAVDPEIEVDHRAFFTCTYVFGLGNICLGDREKRYQKKSLEHCVSVAKQNRNESEPNG